MRGCVFAIQVRISIPRNRIAEPLFAKAELKEVHRILRCPVEFMHAIDSWVLPESVIEQPIISNDSHLLQILESHAEDLLSARRQAPGVRRLVETTSSRRF